MPPINPEQLTPMMQQYFFIKEKYPHAILMFRLGDFFEMFFDDAKTASKALDIALTARECGLQNRAPMCGVPAHAADGYIERLVAQGFNVALCEQIGETKQANGLVLRDVVRVYTPGTMVGSSMLESTRYNYVAAIHTDGDHISLSVADITTGLFMVTTLPASDMQRILDETLRLSPSEILLPDNFKLTRLVESVIGIKATLLPAWNFSQQHAFECLTKHFGTLNLEGFGLQEGMQEIAVAGALLTYLQETQRSAIAQITSLKPYSHHSNLLIDSASRRNLELTFSARERVKEGSLLWVLDSTKTSMGARLLRDWVECPLAKKDAINRRLDSVAEWVQMPIERVELREYLNTISDIERLMTKLTTRSTNARDLITLKTSLKVLPNIEKLIQNTQAEVNAEIRRTYDDLADIYENIHKTIIDNPPVAIKEGGMIREGFDTELDVLRDTKENTQHYIDQLEAREKEETGISTLKIKYSRVFGYVLEVTASQLQKVPDRYIRKQTLANCERYYTEELKELEETILSADDKIIQREYALYNTLRQEILDQIERIQFTSRAIASLDAIQSFAEVAEKNRYTKPLIKEDMCINIEEGRHPVVEMLTSQPFVPNTTNMDTSENRLAVITGPNMAGKSTYMRQVALIVLMAQIGSFVPATKAEIGIVDRIFTRVGASDDLATGQSTFMVEMTEVANILNNATKNSLVLLDEIGRGTSTFDGLSIAWAVLEYIVDTKKIGSKTLFATHYHELTQLEQNTKGVKNFCFTAHGDNKNIAFLRKLEPGAAGQSYGIHVAKLAGLPRIVLKRAASLLTALNDSNATKDLTSLQVLESFSDSKEAEMGRKLIESISKIDVDQITPIEAMIALQKLKETIGDF